MNAPPACDVSAPPSARDVRTDLPRWLALAHNGPDVTHNGPGVAHNGMAPTLVGARVPRARRHPTPARGSVVGRPAAPRAGGGPPGTSAPTILPPAPTWPLPFSHPHPLGPYHSPTRTHIGPYHSPARTHLAPTILSPAPTWPRRWLYNGPAREVPAPPSARDAHSLPPYASIPCASRAPRNSPPKI